MGNAYVSCYMHCIFSTKDRRKRLTPDIQPRLWSYMGGITRNNKMKAIYVGGVEDHIHMLLSLSSTRDVAKAMQLIKGNSSKWIHDTFPAMGAFQWQIGYGAFSTSLSHLATVIEYIKNQKRHHQVKTFKEEFRSYLDAHHIPYEEKYLWV